MNEFELINKTFDAIFGKERPANPPEYVDEPEHRKLDWYPEEEQRTYVADYLRRFHSEGSNVSEAVSESPNYWGMLSAYEAGDLTELGRLVSMAITEHWGPAVEDELYEGR